MEKRHIEKEEEGILGSWKEGDEEKASLMPLFSLWNIVVLTSLNTDNTSTSLYTCLLKCLS